MSGIANAAASVITPRVPAQLSAVISAPESRCSRSAAVVPSSSASAYPPSRACSAWGAYWVATSHSGRTSTTTATVMPVTEAMVEAG